jgi:peptidoglycan/xylan/chitin deacetylase (PgdA/CDA1 family)
MLLLICLTVFFFIAGIICFCIFFDQAILTRRGTIYQGNANDKKVAITFDDGPSPVWTPRILDALRESGVKATFFMLGQHVHKYPHIARRVAAEGHTIGNHGYAHSVMLYYTVSEIEEEIQYTQQVIRQVTGVTTRYFRPPKAWLRRVIKKTIQAMGYEIVLWSLNSKDWVTFHHQRMVRYLVSQVKNGDILLFHDSGHVFRREGGDRTQTVAAIPLLVAELKARGFAFVTVDELLSGPVLQAQEILNNPVSKTHASVLS